MSAIQQEPVSAERAINMRRVWAMPDGDTFNIPCIGALVKSYLYKVEVSIDPFARNKRWATYTNDLNPDTTAEHHLEALEFLALLQRRGVTGQLGIFDPPYSVRQCAEIYKSVGRAVAMRDTQIFGKWTEHKQILASLIEPNGIAISCGWNSQGMGLKNGFAIIEILIVCHGGGHNDTIVTVERKTECAQNMLNFAKTKLARVS